MEKQRSLRIQLCWQEKIFKVKERNIYRKYIIDLVKNVNFKLSKITSKKYFFIL